ncbi:hypothetical protein H1J40_15070 [Mycobacterium canettii]|uniref:CCHC-type domain-containing protein n=2 Tax=Mycobacterium canetti TaxID=78331 RepID=A0AB72XIE6_MYCCP|nr:hypothetical protein [Mycobacterium canetti]CCC43389.1 putative uncharacterised protein [Mycobacterium canettii CIPT 140010059]
MTNPANSEAPEAATSGASEPTLTTNQIGNPIMSQHPVNSDQQAADHQLERCENCGRYGWHSTEKCPDSERSYYGHHASWCIDRDEGRHDVREPYCQYQVGGVDGRTEPDWMRVQLWVSTITPFLHGSYTAEQARAEERHRTGVQIARLVYDGSDWIEQKVNLRSGDARSLAALFVAAADISDGISRVVRS